MGDRGDRAAFSCSSSDKEGRKEALELSVTSPSSELSEGVDMDFLRTSEPGSLGVLWGQGVRGTYWSEAASPGQDPSPGSP